MYFNLNNTGSSLLLYLNLIFYDYNVHFIYKCITLCLFLISYIYHGSMINSNKKYYCKFFKKELKCSEIVLNSKKIKFLKFLDWFLVSIIIFYTAVNDILDFEYIFLISLFCVSISSYTHYFLCFISFILVFLKLNFYLRIILSISSFVATSVFLSLPENQWVNYYRYIWHMCCAINIYIGSLINVY